MERDEPARSDVERIADPLFAERFRKAEELFHLALEVPPKWRDAWLAEAAIDDELRTVVAELLAHHRDDERLTGVEGVGVVEPRPATGGPASVGPYRILGELGQGGMGLVYEAEREDIGKRVALKLARGSALSAERVRRFELEQRVLARLQHPNIAQLHDAGVTDDGTPYFAMEIVEGETIIAHARRAGLNIRGRLQLFLDVCAAVQHAHRNLVVHRDLKPSNVLVTREGRVKLLDFGVAKLIEDTDSSGLTRTEIRIYTPGYAAPEQLRGDAVTTATDVYQLGALLYELLSGAPVFPVSGLPPYEAGRRVIEDDAPAPSRVAEGEGDRAPAIPVDLDSIILKALEKQPERRYSSVEALAADIGRFLEGKPVRARAGGWPYRSRKFVRRHRVGAAIGVLVLGSAGTALVQARVIAAERDRAEREAETARQVSDFLVGLFRNASPGEGAVDAVTLVDRGAEQLERELTDQPEVRASFQEALGRVYNALGRYDQASTLLGASLATRRELFGDDAAETASSRHFLAQLAFSRSDYDRAERLGRVALADRERAFGRASPEVLESLGDLAAVLYNTAEYAKAEPLAREAVAIGRRIFPGGDERTGTALNTLANVLWAQGDREEARGVMREASEVHRSVYGGGHPGLAITLNNLAFMTHASGGPLDEARAAATEALAMQRRLYPDGHPDIAWTLNNLGMIALLEGDTAEAEAAHREALEMRVRLLAPDHADLIQSHGQLARLTLATGRLEEAERHLREALRITAVVHGPDHPFVARYTYLMAQVEFASGRVERALGSLERAWRAGRTSYGPDHPTVVGWGRELGGALRDAGYVARALEVEAALPRDSVEASGR